MRPITPRRIMRISKATYVRLYAVTRTGFRGYASMPETDCGKILDEAIAALAAVKAPYEEIERAHIEDYRALYFNQSLTLAEGEGDVAALLKKARAGKPDAELIELLYDFGKYMTICGSRTSQPLNLQGQWNSELRPQIIGRGVIGRVSAHGQNAVIRGNCAF